MAESIFEWVASFGGKELALLLISFLPIVELRGAVPVGIALGLPWYEVLTIAVIGNMLPVPFILLLCRKIMRWLKSKPRFAAFAQKIEGKLMSRSKNLKTKLGLGLRIFIAIPLPGTGAWTGAGIAALLGLPLRKSLVEIFFGVVIAGIIMTIVSSSVATTIKLF